MLALVTPDLRVDSVLEIGLPLLQSMGVQSLLIDVDCTLKNYRAETARPEVLAWLAGLRAAGIGVCLVSNGREARIRRFAETLDVPLSSRA
jgi:uncharacterized protein